MGGTSVGVLLILLMLIVLGVIPMIPLYRQIRRSRPRKGERSPTAIHRFVWTNERIEDFAPGYLPLMHSRCVHCGDERMIYMGLDPTRIRDGGCIIR